MTDQQTEEWTVLRLLEWTTQFFRQRGSESPRLEAEILLAHARGCERIALYTAFNEVPDDKQRTAFREMVRRRGEGSPVAYLVGYKEFYSLKLRVNESVLIPRPETEHVVIEALDAAKAISAATEDDETADSLRIADVGTGSGAIAVAIAKHLDHVELIAVDSSEEALEIARYNVQQHGVESSVEVRHSDLLDAVDPSIRFDIICSNPPYVSETEYAQLPASVRDYEPRSALVAGPTGTEVIAQLIELAPHRLKPKGRMIIELSPMIAEDCLELAKENEQLQNQRLVKDLAGLQRLLIVDRKP